MFLQEYTCVLCTQNDIETLHHLLVSCTFAQVCWATLNLSVPSCGDLLQVFDSFRSQFSYLFYGDYYHYVLVYLDGQSSSQSLP